MHEYSIVQALLDQCETEAKKHNATSISGITIKIGKLSGVEPHLLKIAYDTFRSKTICDNATLHIDIQNVVVDCNECNQQSTLDDLYIKCNKCQSTNVKIVDGKEMFLMSLEMDT